MYILFPLSNKSLFRLIASDVYCEHLTSRLENFQDCNAGRIPLALTTSKSSKQTREPTRPLLERGVVLQLIEQSTCSTRLTKMELDLWRIPSAARKDSRLCDVSDGRTASLSSHSAQLNHKLNNHRPLASPPRALSKIRPHVLAASISSVAYTRHRLRRTTLLS